MTRLPLPLVPLLLLPLLTGASPGPAEPGQDPQDEEAGPIVPEVDRVVQEALERFGIAGAAAAVVQDGELVHRQFAGRTAWGDPIQAGTRFRLYSLTKLFTSTAVFQLVDAGKLELERPVGEVLEGLPADWRGVTIAELLSHGSGLPDIVELGDRPEEKAAEEVYGHALEAERGVRYRYNQTNYWLLLRVIERVSGRPFQEFLVEGQLAGAHVPPVFCASLRKRVEGEAGARFPFEPRYDQVHDYLDACNGLLLDLDSVLAWSRRLDEGTLLAEESKARMWSPFPFREPASFAHGWEIHRDGERRSLGFSGSMVTALREFPQDGLTVVFLGNGLQEFFDVEAVIEAMARPFLEGAEAR